MSNTSSPVAPPPASSHPPVGGKSLESLQQLQSPKKGPYKSWRKKYRKIRGRFDGVLEDNRRLFREEHKLEATAKRLREELDGLLELCLDLNEKPSIPPSLRFNIRLPPRHDPPLHVDPNISPDQANALVTEYRDAVSVGRIPTLDLHVVRQQIEQRLAAQGVEDLSTLETTTPHPAATTTAPHEAPLKSTTDDSTTTTKPPDPEPPLNYLTPSQEDDFLARLDARFNQDLYRPPPANSTTKPNNGTGTGTLPNDEDKHFTELTAREQERVTELLNPLSQHNWLKAQANRHLTGLPPTENDDAESFASQETSSAAKPPRKRAGGPAGGGGGGGGKGASNLAKRVGDRAVERAAREGGSPAIGSAGTFIGGEEHEFGGSWGAGGEENVVGRKKGRDVDGTYRVKGGRGGGGSGGGKGKRKREGEGGAGTGTGGKKAKVEG
ncbi:hypothetical protein B0A50_02456 [Salinomyces thailandicus]|uniref:IEC3 subunit of the Ino80 complex, chromatin re-modelling-domain-containing protein n=1 Tax=Salinomyces thailandicus TaxID=706561 RepID=A0A4U0U8G4_9PEZI|nr:hypothetical protein B0A50_02456 [Salinomyces thailandica]